MFEIRFDDRRGVLHLALSGFWSAATLHQFAVALMKQVAEIKRTHESFSVLSDSRAFPVQSPEVSAGFTRLMSGGDARNSGRRAIVVASTLNKMQADRVLAAPNLRVFLSLEEATAWLDEPHGA